MVMSGSTSAATKRPMALASNRMAALMSSLITGEKIPQSALAQASLGEGRLNSLSRSQGSTLLWSKRRPVISMVEIRR